MLYDASSNAVIIAYRLPSRLVISEADTGRVRQDLALCGDSDDLFLDRVRGRIYVSCGGGELAVYTLTQTGYLPTARIKTRMGARTSLFAPQLDRLYVAARADNGEPAAILVFRPR